jgi:DNA replication ATP-dependent helicase Dna2
MKNAIIHTGERPMPRYFLSPHRVARYYFHECDRYLRYTATPKARKAEEGVPPHELDHSLLTKAILDSGYAWESQVLAKYLGDDAVVADPPPDKPNAPKTDRTHSVAATLEALRNARAGQYIYQPTLVPTAGFYAAYGLDPDLVGFSECRPDLLMVEAGPAGLLRLTVLDLKATDEAKLSHRIQAVLYSLILEHVLADNGIDGVEVAGKGGIWLYEHDKPELFDLVQVRPPLETFLTHDLQPILRAPASKAFWHLYFRCEWCDYYRHCRDEAAATDDVSLVPYLSTFAKRYLARTAGVKTVDDLGRFLEHPDAPETLQGSASLRGRQRRLRLSVEALQSDSVHPTGAASVAMPKGEHIRLILTIQSEPLSGSIYGYAVERMSGRDLFGTGSETIARVAAANTESAIMGLREQLIADLMGMLRPVHNFNAAHPTDEEWRLRKTVQLYVFDSYERDLLVEALLQATQDPSPTVQADALALFFYFQHPDLVAAEDHPATEVFFPVVVLTQVVRGVFALPIRVVYRFAEVVAALQPATGGFAYRHTDYFDFELSNRMKSDAIFSVWMKGRQDLVENIEGHLKRRVWGANSVINGVRERLDSSDALFAWPPKFELPAGLGFTHPLLSRLAFVTRYEAVLSYLERRLRRSGAEAERLAASASLRVTAIGGNRFHLDSLHSEVEVETGDFPSWILTRDNASGRRARLSYDDFRYRQAMYAPRNVDIAVATVVSRSGDDLELRLGKSKVFCDPVEGELLTLEPRQMDWNSDRLIAELAALDAEDDPWFLRLVNNPAACRHPLADPRGVRATALALAATAGITPSQSEALAGITGHNLQLVWGPPGTGKTHLVAVTILALAEAHRRAGLPFRVLVTGFTHTAIDNVLRKLGELHRELAIFGPALPIRKIDRTTNATMGTIGVKEVAAFAAGTPICVFGATVWQAKKVEPDDLRYDFVVIDEGSQLKVAEAAIPVRRLHPEGRLLIAGDDRQLPPIVQGHYPVPDGEPLLHRSILECLRDRDPEGATLATLLENFRMNDALCAYPRSSIYPPAYGPANEAVASRRLCLSGQVPTDPVVAAILDPTHPMVMCVTDGLTATAENREEAALVARVAVALRENSPDMDDEAFWRHRLFIVSPHHAQNRAIRRELHRLRRWESPPFVDTVDAMQGQECDVVLVSYGVADVEFALQEKEFIYSLNRLNVAITRGRMKTVVIVSRCLLEPPLQALDRDDVAAGIAFMQGLRQSCEQANPPAHVTFEGTDLELLRR